jgi:hypothetical protein
MCCDQGSLISTWATTNDDHGRAAFFHEAYPTTLPAPLQTNARV